MPPTTDRAARRTLIIPAAGRGSRLRSPLPKVLVPVAGRAMIDWLLDLYAPFVERAVVVASPAFASQVQAHVENAPVPTMTIEQATPTGMLDAILVARQSLSEKEVDRVWITWCDQIAIDPRTVSNLARLGDLHPETDVVMPTCRHHSPYIHLQRGDDGRIIRILHRREGDTMPAEGESDMGLFSLSRRAYFDDLWSYAENASTGSGTGERNFLPYLAHAAARGGVMTFPAVDEREAVGVNTPEDLALIARHLLARTMR